jgi:hypothetical protein
MFILLFQKMGRGKLSMELIEKEKTRSITFQKRKKGLLKKAYEFSTLCGVDTCVIIYGPKINDRPAEVSTWPENRDEVERVIKRYKTDTKVKPSRVTFDLSDFFIDRKKKVNDETSRLRKNIFEARYPTWDDRIEMLSEDQLRAVLDVMDTKVEAAGMRISRIKGSNQQHMIGKPTSAMVVSPPELIRNQFNTNMQALCQEQLFDPPMKPLDPQYWSSQFHHVLPLDYHPSVMDNSFKKLLHGDDHWTHQLGSVSTAGNIHAPLNIEYPSSNYNMVPAGVMENTFLSNHLPSASMNYYDLSRQLTPQYLPYGPYPMMPNISSHGFQVNDLYDIGEFDMKNKHLL